MGWITLDVGGEKLRVAAEITLTMALFTDASCLNLRARRRNFPLSPRRLGVGLPLTVGLGAVAAEALFGGFTSLETRIGGRHPGTHRRRVGASNRLHVEPDRPAARKLLARYGITV